MLRCEWDEIVKNRFSSSAPFPKSPTSIKSAGKFFCRSSPSIWICQRQISKNIYLKPNIQTGIPKTTSKIPNTHKKYWEFFSFSPGPPSVWISAPKSNIQNPTIDSQIFQAQILKTNISSSNIPRKNIEVHKAQTFIFQIWNSIKGIKTTSPVTATNLN